ncbi:hypothetical protein ABL849_17445 [Variovorax sp. 375MFSha3.1]|uniref:hypothetical protein n=1 Tax=Variovorax sp. 375MFSha3.1 TaxID=3158364 RepID=UPI003AAC5D18
MNDRYATQRIPYARPAGTVHPTEVYDGAELRAACPRAGAYDAMRLPSRLNGRTTTPAPIVTISTAPRSVTARARICVWQAIEPTDQASEALLTPPELMPIVGANGYRPRTGSLAELVIQDLRTMPATVAYTCEEVEAIFGAPRQSVDKRLESCIEAGLLVRVRKGRYYAYTLPAAAAASQASEPPAHASAP